MIVVKCVWVHGHLPYPVHYITRLRAMVARYLTRPHIFMVYTDKPDEALRAFGKQGNIGAVGVTEVPPPTPGVFGWWSKMEMFSPAYPTSGRALYLDLDTLVVNDLSPIVDYPAPFALVPDAGTFQPKTHHKVVKRFNSSVMVWDAGHRWHYLYEELDQRARDTYWGDQDWLGLNLGDDAQPMPVEWFPRLSQCVTGMQYGDTGYLYKPAVEQAKVILCKKPKNDVAIKQWPWFDKMWGNYSK